MKASDAIAKFLAAHQIHFCFELVGGMITHMLDSMATDGRFTIVSMHHEQAAAFAAEGFSRAERGRRIAVAMGTSGPGATNMMTAIGSCWFDSVPCLFITGQVNTHEMRDSPLLRQQGFQELDSAALVKSMTKYSTRVDQVDHLLPSLHRAVSLALSGRQGPTLLDIPNDVQRADIADSVVQEWLIAPLLTDPIDAVQLAPAVVNEIDELCRTARCPLVLIGGGARWAPSFDAWLQGIEDSGIPYVTSLMGHENVPMREHYFSMIGAYGHREANWAIQNCDLLIVLGARMDIRQTGANAGDFGRNAKIVQIDADAAQLNNRVKVHLAVEITTEMFMREFKVTSERFPAMSREWLPALGAKRQANFIDHYPDWMMSPSRIFAALNQSTQGQAVHYVCDVGNHQMWAAQGLRLGINQTVHYNGGMGAMGFALPAAIGVALSSNKKTIVITGDGSIQVNSHELDTLHRLQLDMTIIVMNNFSLGMVKNFQDMYFDGRDQSTRRGYSCPDFVAVGAAHGIESMAVRSLAEWDAALDRMNQTVKPLLIEIIMEGATECRPRLTYGSRLGEE